MIYLKKLLIDNGITMKTIADLVSIRKCSIIERVNCKRDFTLPELETIKDYLISLNIVPINFDIGELLNEVEDEK